MLLYPNAVSVCFTHDIFLLYLVSRLCWCLFDTNNRYHVTQCEYYSLLKYDAMLICNYFVDVFREVCVSMSRDVHVDQIVWDNPLKIQSIVPNKFYFVDNKLPVN
jgi:hypothetical protein